MIDKQLSLFFVTKLYKKLFLNTKYKLLNIDHQFLDKLNNMYFNGHDILYGEFVLYGAKHNVSDLLKNPAVHSAIVVDEFNKFGWLLQIKAIGTKNAHDQLFNLLTQWSQLDCNKAFNANVINVSDVNCQRLYNILICCNNLNINKIQGSLLHNYLQLHINHVMNVFKLIRLKLVNKDQSLFYWQVLLYISVINQLPYVEIILTYIADFCSKNILEDGGHISKNVTNSLLILESLINIVLFLKNIAVNIGFLQEIIDKIAIYIKSMRHSDGSLPNFYASLPVANEQIDRILLLAKSSGNIVKNFRQTGYAVLTNNDNLKCIVDINKNLSVNSLFAFEISCKGKKIITNIPHNKFNHQLLSELNNRLYNSCLVLKVNGKYITFSTNKPPKIEIRVEESWFILKVYYDELSKYGILYHKMIYIAKNDATYVLGEDMLTVSKKANMKIDEAFLRFYFDPSVDIVDVIDDHKLYFSSGNQYYIFCSSDNNFVFNKLLCYYYFELQEISYIDVAFDLNQNIIKNNWYIVDYDNNSHQEQKMSDQVMRILHIVDMQNGFLDQDGSLFIGNLEKTELLIQNVNKFIIQLKLDFFDNIIVSYDTHFKEEYGQSTEAQQFPLHCEYATFDWELCINLNYLEKNTTVYKIYKNNFDVWHSHASDKELKLDYKYRIAYNKLFKVLDRKNEIVSDNLHNFIKQIDIYKKEVYILGVAAEYCVLHAIRGYLARGFVVYVLYDLVLGITDDIIDVLKREYQDQFNLLKIKLINSNSILEN